MSGARNDTIVVVSPSQTHDTHRSIPLSSPPKTGFLTLPFEIRDQIYTYATPQDESIDSLNPTYVPNRCHTGKPSNSILLLNKQTSTEALDNLYGSNTFKFDFQDKAESRLGENFSASNLQRIRKLTITAWAVGSAFRNFQLPDANLWEDIVPRLKHLRFIVVPPIILISRSTSEDRKRELEELMKTWLRWIAAVVGFFAERMTMDGKRVEIDCNGSVETEEVLEGCLSGYGGSRVVEDFVWGDYMFSRGRYSIGEDQMTCVYPDDRDWNSYDGFD